MQNIPVENENRESYRALMLDGETRAKLWSQVFESIESYIAGVAAAPITTNTDPSELHSFLKLFDFTQPVDPLKAIEFTVDGFWRYHVHNAHPRYFGLFVPAPTTMGIVADALAAAFNPALGARHLSPLAVEIERHVVDAFCNQCGYDSSNRDGLLTTGGSEANHTALLTALTRMFPDFGKKGLRALTSEPVLYVSTEGHHSVLKAARLCGLGTDALREIPVDDCCRMNCDALYRHVEKDKARGLTPFLIVATAGTTSAGAIDPISKLVEYAAQEKVWLHVDAAWGGATVLVPELRDLLRGIDCADSITLDVHKWLSIPMGAGLYLTRHADILERTFKVAAPYMPQASNSDRAPDPFTRSMQWSRRFVGLKIFLSLAVAGWDGYASTIRQQISLGDYLREKLAAAGWELLNKTSLPVVCFVDSRHPEGRTRHYLEIVEKAVVSGGQAWISVTALGCVPVLRACITNYRTTFKDVDILIGELATAREQANRRFHGNLA